ncbi:hypothetical protein BDP55DRAFT_638814 [Colletotrichum godetiae]|uniref:Uncharacterized protein n=1 Tax=Colletotrichum godetiae TaxID=1209918 RepID=A0AAJ0A6F2_9PEZI|nr:uncharacterized protein BDP55DRAFT_638814 [Colletotrichum godetiae]KAK1657358.1 hypothetical protein BDP55DRAFT_638814 [Colletotrichum godetiae]
MVFNNFLRTNGDAIRQISNKLKSGGCDQIIHNNAAPNEYHCEVGAAPQTPKELRLENQSLVKLWLYLQEHSDHTQSWPIQCIDYECTEQDASTELLRCQLRHVHYLAELTFHSSTRRLKRTKDGNGGNLSVSLNCFIGYITAILAI